MKTIHTTPELFNMKNVWDTFDINSSALHTETNYVFPILIGVPIALVAHQNTIIKTFIVVCTKYDSPCLIFHIPLMSTWGADAVITKYHNQIYSIITF